MVPFVREHGFGAVVDGWSAEDLAGALNALTVEEIVGMKQAAHHAAAELSTQGEAPRFLAAVGATRQG